MCITIIPYLLSSIRASVNGFINAYVGGFPFPCHRPQSPTFLHWNLLNDYDLLQWNLLSDAELSLLSKATHFW